MRHPLQDALNSLMLTAESLAETMEKHGAAAAQDMSEIHASVLSGAEVLRAAIENHPGSESAVEALAGQGGES